MEKPKTISEDFPFYSFKKTQELLACSRSFLYSLIDQGKIKPKHIGRKPYFSRVEIIKLFNDKK